MEKENIKKENIQNTFNYTYSATQQDEVKRIRDKYIPREESPMEQLRKLDKSAETPGMVLALCIGITGTLLLGIGMCCTMVWTRFFVLGIIIGVIGILGIAAAYPLFVRTTKKQREKLAPQILKLSEELMH